MPPEDVGDLPAEVARVSQQDCVRLLAVGAEGPVLDFKQSIDLASTRDIVELAKDVGAMMVRGGHILIGADSSGQIAAGGGIPTAQRQMFDEANLRGKLRKYLGTGFEIFTAVHQTGGVSVGIVQVLPHPDGFVPFHADGVYDPPGGKTVTVFRRGDIYVREGSSSIKADESQIRALMRPAQRPAAQELLRLGMEVDGFEAAVGSALDDGREVALLRFVESAQAAASRLDTDAAGRGELVPIVDQLGHLGSLALRWDKPKLLSRVVDALESVYRNGLSTSGVPNTLDRVQWLLLVADRVYALGAVAVAHRRWDALETLVLRSPSQGLTPTWQGNWLRQASLWAARAGLLSIPVDSTERAKVAFLEIVLLDVKDLRWANPDAPSAEPLRTRLARFDALASILVNGRATARDRHEYYPWYRAYEASVFEPILADVLTQASLRDAVYPGDNAGLAAVLQRELDIDPNALARLGGAWSYEDPRIARFIEVQRPE